MGAERVPILSISLHVFRDSLGSLSLSLSSSRFQSQSPKVDGTCGEEDEEGGAGEAVELFEDFAVWKKTGMSHGVEMEE